MVNGADGIRDIEGKVARVAASERSCRAARDIDGRTERSKWAGAHESIGIRASFNGADGISEIEGKAAMGSGERVGIRASFKSHRAHRGRDHAGR
jgi:hypothetical protein